MVFLEGVQRQRRKFREIQERYMNTPQSAHTCQQCIPKVFQCLRDFQQRNQGPPLFCKAGKKI